MEGGLIEIKANCLRKYKMFNLLHQWALQEVAETKYQEEFRLNSL